MIAARVLPFHAVVFSLLILVLSGCKQDEIRANAEPPTIEIKATVHAAQSMSLVAQVDGQVERVLVGEGARIAANQEIIALTNPTIERDAAFARAQLEWIEARQRRAGRPSKGTSTGRSDSLEIASRILDLRKRRFEAMKALRKSSDITARDLEHAEIEYLAALRDYNNERRATLSGAAVSDDREVLRIERDKIIAEQRFAEQRRSFLRVASPIGGVVTRLHVVAGQSVFPRDPIADVSDVSTLQVRGEVAPELLRYLRPGMRVDVKVFSVPPRTFADEIDYVIPVQGAGSESRAATVVVTIPNPDGSLQPNTQALLTRSLR